MGNIIRIINAIKLSRHKSNFTDDPYIRPENQQLIIRFTEK